MQRFVTVSVWVCVTATAVLAQPTTAPSSRVTPVVQAYRKVRSAVVNISTTRVVRARWGGLGSDIFDRMFPAADAAPVPVTGLGSGVFIHPDGFVVTNAHVVLRADEITVTLPDKTKFPAKVISLSTRHDLAVLKIDPRGRRMPYLPLGRSDDLMVGETVIAIGNPLGLAGTVTTGVVSALNRTLKFERNVEYPGLIQTDAPINPGNSGGPLLNIHGDLIGINTAIRADAQNIGFAIPVDRLHDELAQLLDPERVKRVLFGAVVAHHRAAGIDEVVVKSVRSDSPAAGRLAPGDRIVAMDGKAIGQMPDFACPLIVKAPGSTADLVVRRDGKETHVKIVLKAKPRPDGAALAKALFGLTLKEVTPELARSARLPVASGMLVVAIEKGGPAGRIGLRPGDVLFQVGAFYVKDIDDLGLHLETLEPGAAIRIGIVRGNMRAWTTLRSRSVPKRQPPAKSQQDVNI